VGGIRLGRGFLYQRAGLGHNANDLSLRLESVRSGACGHGSCLVPVSCEEWSPVGWREWL